MAFHYIRIQSKLLIIVSSLLPVSELCFTPFTPSTSYTRLFSVPIFVHATLSTWNTLSPSQPSSFRFSSTLSPLEPLPSVSFKMVLPAPWWSCLVRSPCSCSSGQLSLSEIILFAYWFLIFSPWNGNSRKAGTLPVLFTAAFEEPGWVLGAQEAVIRYLLNEEAQCVWGLDCVGGNSGHSQGSDHAWMALI